MSDDPIAMRHIIATFPISKHLLPPYFRGTKNTDGNFVKINLKKKSHVKGFALRGAGLRKQVNKNMPNLVIIIIEFVF